MFRKIYVPVDNSDYSNRAIDLAVELGRAFGSTLTGCHVYAARLHDYRFKQMEYTLPEEYRDEHELERQRKIHDSLIAMGLQLVSDSYLEVMRKKTEAAGLPFEPRDDGRQALQGADRGRPGQGLRPRHHGRPRARRGAGQPARLGDRALHPEGDRRHAGDPEPRRRSRRSRARSWSGWTARPQSFHGLKLGIALGKALRRPVHAVAVYDPYLHYAMFNGIVGVLTEKASKVFRFKEQEQLHEEIIDTGLAKIYQSHLEIGRKLAADDGRRPRHHAARRQVLREGADQFCPQGAAVAPDPRAHRRPLRRARGGPRLQHREPAAPGALQRAADRGKFYPPLDVKAEEIIAWTDEAEARMERVPAQVARASPAPRCSATRSSRGTPSSPSRSSTRRWRSSCPAGWPRRCRSWPRTWRWPSSAPRTPR